MLTQIVKNTFLNLNKKGLKATLFEYKKAFSEEAKKLGTNDYDYTEDSILFEYLPEEKIMKLKELNIKNIDELLTHIENSFENFMSNEELRSLISIVRDTLHPSLGSVVNDEINIFTKEVEQNPRQVLDKEMQTKLHKLFEL